MKNHYIEICIVLIVAICLVLGFHDEIVYGISKVFQWIGATFK